VGQSYGGLLAQAYLAHKPGAVERLVLSSSGPADYGKAWLPAQYVAIALSRALPETLIKNLLVRGAMRILTAPDAERAGWREAVDRVLRDELSRADVISHFAVAADVIRSGIIEPRAYRNWAGRVVVMSAENDLSQSKRDFPRYERLFGRAIEALSMGQMGHTAALFDPGRYVELLERALN
jgi:pimeloyl-ACP methyl ester carboxylesterase